MVQGPFAQPPGRAQAGADVQQRISSPIPSESTGRWGIGELWEASPEVAEGCHDLAVQARSPPQAQVQVAETALLGLDIVGERDALWTCGK